MRTFFLGIYWIFWVIGPKIRFDTKMYTLDPTCGRLSGSGLTFSVLRVLIVKLTTDISIPVYISVYSVELHVHHKSLRRWLVPRRSTFLCVIDGESAGSLDLHQVNQLCYDGVNYTGLPNLLMLVLAGFAILLPAESSYQVISRLAMNILTWSESIKADKELNDYDILCVKSGQTTVDSLQCEGPFLIVGTTMRWLITTVSIWQRAWIVVVNPGQYS